MHDDPPGVRESASATGSGPRMHADLLHTMHRYTLAGLLMNGLATGACAWLVHAHAPAPVLALWVVLMVLVTLACGLRAHDWQACSVDDGIAGSRRWLTAGCVATGLLWGAGAVLFLHWLPWAREGSLLILLGGVNVAALVTLANVLPALYAFSLASLLPVLGWMFGPGARPEEGLVGSGFLIAVLLAARLHARTLAGNWHLMGVHELLQHDVASVHSRATARCLGLEQEVQRSQQMEQLLCAEREALKLLATDAPLGAVLQTLNDGVEQRFPGLRCAILVPEACGRRLRVAAADSLPHALVADLHNLPPGESTAGSGTAAARTEPVLVDDIAGNPHWQALAETALAHEMASCWSLPLHGADGAVLGTFASHASRTGPPPDGLLEFLHRLAQIAGIAIERACEHEALRASEQRFRDIAEAASDWFFETDHELRFTYISGRFRELAGIDPESLLGHDYRACGIREVEAAVWQQHLRQLAAREPFRDFEHARQRPDGSLIWVSVNASPVLDTAGGFRGYRGTGRDISARVLATRELRTSEARFREFAVSAADWLWETDQDMRFVFTSEGFGKTTGLRAEDVLGRSRAELLSEHVDDIAVVNEHLDAVRQQQPFRDLLMRWRRPDGVVRHLRSSGMPVFDEHHEFTGYRGTTRDITVQQQLLQRISYQATHDSLTGLVNRDEFEQVLQRTLEHARREHGEHSLCYLDLDQFKVVNDTCGHVAGDDMLRRIAGLLQTHMEPGAVLARLGGDEFGVLMADTPLDKAARRAELLCDAVYAFRFDWDGETFSPGVSIGVSAINDTTVSVTTALSAADSACYMAKEQGRQRVQVDRPGDVALAHRQGEMQWVARLTRALEEERFELACQPIVPLSQKSRGLHFEVLLRLRGEDGELIPPGAFLGAAERYNLGVDLDRWVLRSTLSWLARHREQLSELALCALNLSGPSLADERFLAFAMSEFERTGVPGASICFEITETAAIANLSRAVHFIESLRLLGCSFALDDFGSGLSSFAYLKTLPVDYLKIDGVFVRDIAIDPIGRAMVRSINEIGHVMGKQTIAEFVEDEAALEVLRSIGVDHAQGFHVGRPQPLSSLLKAAAAA